MQVILEYGLPDVRKIKISVDKVLDHFWPLHQRNLYLINDQEVTLLLH